MAHAADQPKFTPGPWAVSEDPRPGMEWNNEIVTAADYDNRICYMANGGKERADEFLANAFLIAAAPDLYAALEGVLRIADRKTVEFDVARAALAKARGEAA